ncbi:hypothetical protein [Kineothrix sedimenti]|uniref:Uncharacterized protein n=1 Tax=Kineothrix sedimenti TaxID=3123317 RepID=A0ABZ3EX14_9FIRM
MSRKNIFDVLEKKMDINYEMRRILEMYNESVIDNYTLEEYFDEYCLSNWKNRNRFLSTEEMRIKLNITDDDIIKSADENTYLFFLEFIFNLIWQCDMTMSENEFYTKEFNYLYENVQSVVDYLGYEVKVFGEQEKVLLVEKNAAMTAVAEIVEPNLAYEVIEYNHHSMKGDISGKQKILKILTDKFEPIRGELKKINKELESSTGYLLNKMNIRHNNIEGKNAIGYVKNLSNEELEEWYDEIYQMLLLCILEYDNIERNKKVGELKNIIEGG